MNQSNNEMNKINATEYDLIPNHLYISTSVDGLHSMVTTIQMDSSKLYHSIDHTTLKQNTTEEKIIANKCEYYSVFIVRVCVCVYVFFFSAS